MSTEEEEEEEEWMLHNRSQKEEEEEEWMLHNRSQKEPKSKNNNSTFHRCPYRFLSLTGSWRAFPYTMMLYQL
jgi:hypothetical protein